MTFARHPASAKTSAQQGIPRKYLKTFLDLEMFQ
jgi:hypothetical protein